MKWLVAIELIGGAVFLVVFWYRNLELQLTRCSRPRLLDPCGEESNAKARIPRSSGW